MDTFDIVVIGSGPGGYVAAIRSAQLGLKTAIIEKYNTLGGTCLNVGCIPSKALLDSSHHYYDAVSKLDVHGIEIDKVKLDFPKMVARKNEVVTQTSSGINYLMEKNKIQVFHGVGSFIDTKTIEVKGETTTQIGYKNTIIATGSKPASLPFIKIDKKRIITSTEALSLKEVPKHLIVIGGGVIGLELGSVYKRLGSKVSVIEYLPTIIPGMDGMLSKELQKSLKKQGVKFFTNYKVTGVEAKGEQVFVNAENKKGEQETFEGDYVLVSVGRKAYTENLGLEKVGIKTDAQGKIEIDESFKTSTPNIYAIGDVVRGAMLAHKAEEEGVCVAEIIANQKPHINYQLIPSVVYCWPEVAAVGKTEEQLKEEKAPYKSGVFQMRALGRARASTDIDGQVKVLTHQDTDEILGVHIIGARAADLIAEAVIAMEFRASAEDIARSSHAHPTYSEAFKEACLAALGRAIHS